ncbi:hypothetical protein predicted by Glimmer/Critica [Helicobacter pylori B8]|uniref:Uncharacterized protein n=1 Tax=Helicobacter pylori (strain B8) TaxID=693745 RepID=D7FCB9_HELP3|nr:hypothetical protein predicted by Glimmer/Critica [Helicobacter pylori B8]
MERLVLSHLNEKFLPSNALRTRPDCLHNSNALLSF